MSSTAIRTLPRDDTIPADEIAFRARFATEKACVAFLRRWRYPEGFRCPRCDATSAWWLPCRKMHECRACGRQTSLTAGTVFHGTRTPLRRWFVAMYHFVFSKGGISALELSRKIGISQPTAWTWLHKLRVAMEDRHQALLAGVVEVDEAYIGGLEEGRGGRSLEKKACVGAAVEVPPRGPGLGRIRLADLPDAGVTSLTDFVDSQIDRKAIVRTDGWRGYRDLEARGFRHQRLVMSGRSEKAHEVFPGVHRVFSLLRRLLLGTYQGAVSRRHLQKYLGEFEFRFNRRTSLNRSLLFQRLLSAGVADRAITYPQLTEGKEKGWPVNRWAP